MMQVPHLSWTPDVVFTSDALCKVKAAIAQITDVSTAAHHFCCYVFFKNKTWPLYAYYRVYQATVMLLFLSSPVPVFSICFFIWKKIHPVLFSFPVFVLLVRFFQVMHEQLVKSLAGVASCCRAFFSFSHIGLLLFSPGLSGHSFTFQWWFFLSAA